MARFALWKILKKIFIFVCPILFIILGLIVFFLFDIYKKNKFPDPNFRNKKIASDELLYEDKDQKYRIYRSSRDLYLTEKVKMFFNVNLRDMHYKDTEKQKYCYIYLTDLNKKVAIEDWSKGDTYGAILRKGENIIYRKQYYDGYSTWLSGNNLYHYDIGTESSTKLFDSDESDLQAYVLSEDGNDLAVILNSNVLVYSLDADVEKVSEMKLGENFDILNSKLADLLINRKFEDTKSIIILKPLESTGIINYTDSKVEVSLKYFTGKEEITYEIVLMENKIEEKIKSKNI